MYVTLAKLSFHFSGTRKQFDIQIGKLELMYVSESEVDLYSRHKHEARHTISSSSRYNKFYAFY